MGVGIGTRIDSTQNINDKFDFSKFKEANPDSNADNLMQKYLKENSIGSSNGYGSLKELAGDFGLGHAFEELQKTADALGVKIDKGGITGGDEKNTFNFNLSGVEWTHQRDERSRFNLNVDRDADISAKFEYNF